MPHNILTIRHSGSSFIGNTRATAQYGGPMVATTTIPGGHFVWLDEPLGRIPSPGLPIPLTSTKPLGVATCAGTKGRVHDQPACAIDSGSPDSLPGATTAHQP